MNGISQTDCIKTIRRKLFENLKRVEVSVDAVVSQLDNTCKLYEYLLSYYNYFGEVRDRISMLDKKDISEINLILSMTININSSFKRALLFYDPFSDSFKATKELNYLD